MTKQEYTLDQMKNDQEYIIGKWREDPGSIPRVMEVFILLDLVRKEGKSINEAFQRTIADSNLDSDQLKFFETARDFLLANTEELEIRVE